MDTVARTGSVGNAAAAPCPFVGARPFEGADKAFFFGRDREARDLATMVAACTLTVVYGPSGAGKSSLLNTRLLDELALIEPDWIVVSFASWQDRFETPLMSAVRDALTAQAEIKPPDIAIERLVPILLGAVKETGRPIVLVLDQFEEYFLYHGHGAADFEAGIARLASRRSSAVRIVFGVRNDRLFLLDRLRGGIPDILQNLFLIDRLDERGARDAVLKPIEAYNQQTGRIIRADEDVVNAVVKGADEREIFQRLPFRGRGMVSAEAGDGAQPSAERTLLRVVAPFLQLALEALWHHDIECAGGTTMTLAGLRVLARAADDSPAVTLVGQLMQQHLDGLLSARSEAEQTVCAKLFDRMVTYTGGKVAVALPDDFTAVLDEAQLALAATLLKDLAAPGPSRLVRPVATDDPTAGAHRGSSSSTRFEIVHDALAVPILDWVSRWRERRAQQETAEREQATAAKALADANAREALERAQREAAEAREVTERERFAAAEAEARRRGRWWKVGSSGVVLLLIVASLIGWTILQYSARQTAITRFDTFAEKDSTSEYRLRLLLALSSLSEASGPWRLVLDSARAEHVLRDTLQRAPRYGGTVLAAAPDLDAARLAILNTDHSLIVLTLADGATRTVLSPAQYDELRAPARSSASEKLAQTPFAAAVGFVTGLNDPVFIQSGRLFYRPNEVGTPWRVVDTANLLPEKFESQSSFIISEITAGSVQVTGIISPAAQLVVRLRPARGPNGMLTFERASTLPPPIQLRGPRQRPALSPWLPDEPHDRFAYLSRPRDSGRTLMRGELDEGDLSKPDDVRTLWEVPAQSLIERVQQGIDSGGSIADPSVAFADDGNAIVVRIGRVVDIVRLTGATAVEFSAPASLGDAVNARWGGPPIAATRVVSSPTGKAIWRVAWQVPGWLAVFDVAEGTSTVPTPRLLRTGLDNAYRLDFSTDGRFVVIETFPGPQQVGVPTQQFGVWDLGEDWKNELGTDPIPQLSVQACSAASFERPDGAAFTRDELVTWVGANGVQPCAHAEHAPSPTSK